MRGRSRRPVARLGRASSPGYPCQRSRGLSSGNWATKVRRWTPPKALHSPVPARWNRARSPAASSAAATRAASPRQRRRAARSIRMGSPSSASSGLDVRAAPSRAPAPARSAKWPLPDSGRFRQTLPGEQREEAAGHEKNAGFQPERVGERRRGEEESGDEDAFEGGNPFGKMPEGRARHGQEQGHVEEGDPARAEQGVERQRRQRIGDGPAVAQGLAAVVGEQGEAGRAAIPEPPGAGEVRLAIGEVVIVPEALDDHHRGRLVAGRKGSANAGEGPRQGQEKQRRAEEEYGSEAHGSVGMELSETA